MRERFRRWFQWTGGVIAVSLLGTLHADIIHMKSGQKVEGKIVSDGASALVVETKFGRMSFDRSKIDRIEYQRLPVEEVRHRREAAGNDPVKLYEVALYAQEQKLTEEYRKILEEVLQYDSNHAAANAALGKTFYDGQWFTPEELDKHLNQLSEQMKARGKVLHEGKWVNEDTAKRLQGFELYKGQWLRWKEIYTLQSQEKMPELLGLTLKIRDSEHFTLRSNLDEETQKEILEVVEMAWDHFFEVFQPTEKEAYIMGFYPIPIYVLPDPNAVTKFVEPNGYMIQLYNPPKGINERYLDANSFPVFFPRPLIVTSEGRHLKGGGNRITSQIGFISHYTGNLLVRRFKRGGMVPGWVETGMSHYYEGMLNGYQTLSITEYVGYEHIEKWDMTLQTFPQWYTRMADPDFRRTLPSLKSIRGKIAEELNAFELVKAYFMTYWLMETRQKTFVDYIRAAFEEKFEIRVRTTEEEAFEQAFGVPCDELEAQFEEWAARLPPHPPT
ncbi:MAG: hypothetical protein V2A76_15300 [Planctomycetota bacterium]